jgi:hypothetical protein
MWAAIPMLRILDMSRDINGLPSEFPSRRNKPPHLVRGRLSGATVSNELESTQNPRRLAAAIVCSFGDCRLPK